MAILSERHLIGEYLGELVNLAGNPDYRDREEAMRSKLLERTIEAGDPR